MGWKHHFENLTKNSIHEHFDNKYQQKIEQEYIDITDICRGMFQHQTITENEVEEALKLLNLNKSLDIFGISTENLLYGGPSLIHYLKELLDSTFRLFIYQMNRNNSILPTFNEATHIGICRIDDNLCKATIEENLKKSRRTLYSLIGVGLYGENGLDPQTSMSIMNTYIIPIMLYGLEIVIPTGKCLETLNIQFKKKLKQLLSLPKTADPAIYIVSVMLPVEA
ncbi:unnamed protein product [Mytilus coruscus]|uniref:Uncharacterized protein n=1 Tax=Mytilus coruscus TaxID=42192 RepID=A0A6J8D8V3_MYTCO|nr:unnamed protein product [Mytilus coruscus]